MRANAIFAAALAVASFLLPAAVGAATFTADWSVDANASDPGLVVGVYPGAGTFSADLEVGESFTGKLFRIWTDETTVNADDRVATPISVSFGFTSPDIFGGVVTGETVGRSFLGIIQHGELTWDAPLTLNFGAGGSGQVTLALADAMFNTGLFGLSDGKKWGADVYGTLTYNVSPVPLPAALPLLLGGIALIGAVSRRRQTA